MDADAAADKRPLNFTFYGEGGPCIWRAGVNRPGTRKAETETIEVPFMRRHHEKVHALSLVGIHLERVEAYRGLSPAA